MELKEINQDTPAADWGYNYIEKSVIIGAEVPGNFGYGAVAAANDKKVTIRFVAGISQGKSSGYLPNFQSASFSGTSCADVLRKINWTLKQHPEVSWAESVPLARSAIRKLLDYANE